MKLRKKLREIEAANLYSIFAKRPALVSKVLEAASASGKTLEAAQARSTFFKSA